MTDLTHQEISDVLFLKNFFVYQEEACSFFVFFWAGGRWCSILGDLGVKILKITDNQNVLGKVGGNLLHVVSRVQSLVPESQLSHQLKGFVHVTKNEQETGCMLHVAVSSFINCLPVCVSVYLPVCLSALHPMLARQPLHCASQW